jgi:putative ABC transport system substrate-binding protein
MATMFLAFTLGSAPLAGEAQQAAKIPRVGLLRPGSPPDPYVDAFRRGLQDLGYIEPQSISFEYRWAEGRLAQLSGLAAELVQLKVDVIVTQGEEAARAVKEATRTIPIVMATSGDPVGAGLVASLAGVDGLLDELRDESTRHVPTPATYVDKIIKGARPADLPVEQPTKFDMVVNARTAKTLGLTIPPSILGRADRVIQ